MTGGMVASTLPIAGCLGVNEPDLEVTQLVHPDPRMVSITESNRSVSGTIQNQVHSGNVTARLFWFLDESAPDPSSIEPQDNPDIEFDVARTWHFDRDERREESIHGEPPSEWVEYGMVPEAASYGATIRNNGESGEGEIKLTYPESDDESLEQPGEKVEYIASDDELTVMFDVTIATDVYYEITAKPN